MKKIAIAATLTCAFAQEGSAEVLKWNCHFEERSTLDGVDAESMLLKFTVDTVSQRAFMEGNAGFVEVEIYVGDSAFSFAEKVGSGAIQTTTVTMDGLAVHSRNTVISGEIVAAQHFGRCLPGSWKEFPPKRYSAQRENKSHTFGNPTMQPAKHWDQF